jgi:hypothetical protein
MQIILIFLGEKSPNFQYHQDEIKIHEIRTTYYQKLFHIFDEKCSRNTSATWSHIVFFFGQNLLFLRPKIGKKLEFFP